MTIQDQSATAPVDITQRSCEASAVAHRGRWREPAVRM